MCIYMGQATGEFLLCGSRPKVGIECRHRPPYTRCCATATDCGASWTLVWTATAASMAALPLPVCSDTATHHPPPSTPTFLCTSTAIHLRRWIHRAPVRPVGVMSLRMPIKSVTLKSQHSTGEALSQIAVSTDEPALNCVFDDSRGMPPILPGKSP